MVESNIRRIGSAVSLRAEVERALSAAIVSGELEADTIVSVPALAAQFEVSATPVREAMLDLENRGFVESVRNKGFRITSVSEADLREIVQVRQLLECPAVRMAAADFPHDRLAELRALAQKIVVAAHEGRFPDYLAADSEFHLIIMGIAGNSRLVSIVAELRSSTRMVGLSDLRDTVELERTSMEHHLLLDLLVEGRGDEAEALMHAHIGHVLGWWAGRPEAGVEASTDDRVLHG